MKNTMRIWRYYLVLLWICLVPLSAESASHVAQFQTVHGRWVIDSEATKKENLLVYFDETKEHNLLTKASSTIFTFDTKKMVFIRTVLGKETRIRIQSIERSQNHSAAAAPETLIVWLQHVKFPDYIIPLPDGRLRYGSEWGRPWEFVLKRQ